MQRLLERPHAVVRSVQTTKQLTVIVPIRIDETNAFRLSRLSHILQDPTALDHVDVIVADDGSPTAFATSIEEACRLHGFSYERLNTSNKFVSMSRARNRAAQVAKTPFIFIMDADLLPPAGFFAKLTDEMRRADLDRKAEDMVMVPVAYLNQEATDDYLGNNGAGRFDEFLDHTLNRNEAVIERYSSGTSACVYNRLYYLARGGYREDFTGWGFEDMEFNLRVGRLTRKFPLPADYVRDESTFDRQFEYRGWKSFYRLFGDRSLYKGLLLFHAWHPVVPASPYQRKRPDNQALFNKAIAEFATNGAEPEPLPDPAHGRSLVLKKSPFTSSRILRPMLGEAIQADPEQMPSDDGLGEMLKSRRIDRIVFQNPYASPETRRVYDWARANDFPFMVCERGALNGSVLFDRTGFLADSRMFDEKHWSTPLTREENSALDRYIQEATGTAASLEDQTSKRYTPAELREKIGASSSDTIVLVCLQRPNDTATRFFPGPLGTYGDFVWTIERLSRTLPPHVRIVFKVHPLEDHVPDIQGFNASDCHIHDLMDVADKLVVFSSGTGITAMLWNLPVVVCGNAFYRHPKLVHGANSDLELEDLMCSDLSIDHDARRRFLHYLRFSYYSFGEFVTRPVRMPDGSRMTATTEIKFSVIRGFGQSDLTFAARPVTEDAWQSMLFDRFVGAKKTAARAQPIIPPNWQGRKAVFYNAYRIVSWPIQGRRSRERLRTDPVEFFKAARNPVNKMVGKYLLSKG